MAIHGCPFIRAAAIQHARDPRVLQPRQQLALAPEALALLGRVDIAHHLDRDVLAEAAVIAHAVVDRAHPAAAEQTDDAVRADAIGERRIGRQRALRRGAVQCGGLRLQAQQGTCFGGQRGIRVRGEHGFARRGIGQIERPLDQFPQFSVEVRHPAWPARWRRNAAVSTRSSRGLGSSNSRA
jgi:hypothetical protein